MTTQPRGISTPGYQPSPSQPIPNRYSHPQFGSGGQAYSPRHVVQSSSPHQLQHFQQAGIAGGAHDLRHVPSSSPHQLQQYFQQGGIAGSAHDIRHVVPSSSPHQSQYYQQAGIASNAHDMYKGPGVVGTGTPPMMQPQQPYYNGGHAHRPRGPIPGPRGMYYHTILQRYPSMPAQTSPAQYQYSNQPQYQQYMPQAPQIAHNQAMYGPATYQPQYTQPPPQQIGSVQAQAMMPQQPSSQKKERKGIRIVDPNTHQDITEDIRSQRQDSLSTPPSGRSSATPPGGDVAAKFAAQVAAAAGTSAKSASSHFAPPVDTQSIMINQNTQLMQQMQQEQQIVGSPNMSSPMVSPYMNMPGPASSPRLPNMPPLSQPVMMPQQYVQQMTPFPATHHPQMLSASPGLAATLPQVQHGQMSMSPQMLNQMPSPVYQLPPQHQTEQFGRSTHAPIRLVTSNIPDNAHTSPARPQQVNIASGEPAVPSQPLSRPLIQQPPQAVPMLQTTARAQLSKDVMQTDGTPVPSQQTDSAPVATRLVACSSPKEQEPVQSISDATQNGKSTIKVLPSVPSAQSEGANTTDNAAVSSESSVDDVAIVHTQEALINTVAEKLADARHVEPVPSMPEKTEQTLEKEDTAIRLEGKTLPSIPAAEHKPSSDASANVVSVVNPPPTAQKDIDTSKLPTETAGDVKSAPDPDVAPSLPTPETEAVKQEASGSSSPVNKISVTSPSKVAPLQSAEEKAPVPSAKTTVEKLDNKTELPPVQSQAQGQPKAAENQPSKSRVKSPEPSKAPISESSEPVRKDSTSTDRQQTPLTSSQKVSEKPVVNGLDTSAESESGDVAKKTEKELPSTKITKMADVKQTAESRSPRPKVEPARSLSVSSEKSSSEKGTESEKTNGVAPGKSKLTAEIKYEGDQWSPQNPKGKRQYDSSFLLQFQYRPSSLEKPKDLPNIDIVLEQPHNKIANPMQPMESRSGADFTPNYMRGPGPRRPVRQTSRDHGKMGRSTYSGPAPRIIQKVVSIDRDVQLKTTENAWKPIKRDKNLTSKLAKEELEILEVIREVRAILNKLTPNTFPALMKKVLSLKIDTERKLRGTIDLIFEKAIDEPNFSEAYANMCRQMTSIRVTPDEASGTAEQTVEFRKLLLTKCQKEFEKNKSDQENLLELKKKMEANTNKEIAPQLQEEYGLAETRERHRTLGNIRFIGELYKLRMLTESIMHNCIMALFKARDDDHLESLCRLLTTIGKDLDHQKGKQRMDQYFEQLKKNIQEKRTSSRVRFMLQDVYDLRLNNWVPRAITTQGPKTISQIHQDAKQEQELLQLKLATTAAPAMKQGGRQQNRMGSRGHGEDGWTKVQTPAKPTRFDPTKMKLKSNQFDETKVTLGPSRVYGAGWKSGSAGSGLSKTGSGGYSPSGSMDKTQETGRSNTPTRMKNRFSALSQGQGPASDYDNTRRPGGRQSSREGSRTGSRGSMGPPSSGSVGRTPHKDERSSVLEAARRLTSTERNYDSTPKSSRESSPSVKSQSSTPRQQQTAHKYNVDLDEEKMQQKSKNILVEFLSIVDFKEATECIEELNAPPSLMHALVHIAHEFTLEKKREERINVGRLLAHLLKLGRLSVEQYVKGLADLLDMATDYEIDVPMVWEYIAEQMSPVFEDDSEADVPLSCLAELAAPLSDENKSGIFVAEVVKAVIKRVTLEVFAQRWKESNMLWSKIVGKNDQSVDAFLAQHNLSELSDSKGSSTEQGVATWQSTSGIVAADEQYTLEQDTLEQDITKLLEDGLSNEDIFVWVEKNVPRVNVTEPPFLRALTIAVCKKAMDAEGKNVIEDRISERGIVLKKYIDSDPERELQAVYALQHMMVVLDQPANVLRKFFDVLYNEDVITEQTFYKWEKCDDPNEQEGRGVAVASVNPFFTWLRTAELESD